MRRRLTVLVFILLAALQVFGQVNRYGFSLLKNYPHIVTNGSEQNWTITQDHRGVMYFGNNDKGILEYDGNEWRTIPISNNSIIRSLLTYEDGTIYVGAIAELGYLAPNQSGNLQYQSLLPKLDTSYHRFSDVWKIYSQEDQIYFCSEKYIMVYTPETELFKVINTYPHTLFCFLENEKLYSGAFVDGLVELNGDSIVRSKGGDYFASKNIFGLTAYDNENLIVGTWQDGLSLYNIESGKVDSLFASRDVNQYLKNHLVTSIIKLPAGDFLISTYTGGLVVVSPQGRMKEQVTKFEGLHDDQIYSSYISPGSYPYSLAWSALSLGVAKTELGSPFKIFTTEYGFQGLILDICSIEDKLYIGTSAGLYTLVTSAGKASFAQVANLNFSVWEFQKFRLNSGKDVLLAITSEGLYQVNNDGTVILLDEIVQNRRDPEGSRYWGYSITQDPKDSNRIVLGRETSINFLNYRNGTWYEEFNIEKLDGQARTLAIDKDGELWFGATLAGIGKVNSHDTLARPVYYGSDQGLPTIGENSVMQIGDEILFGTKKGIYRYDETNDMFLQDTVYNKYLPEGDNWIFIIYMDLDGSIWISFENSQSGWMVCCLEPDGDNLKPIIRPFYSLTNLSSTDAFFSDVAGSVWFPKSNILYHYQKGVPMIDTAFYALVRKVTVNSDSVIYNGAFPHEGGDGNFRTGLRQDKELIPHIRHSENNIEFRWSSPYFDQEDQIEFSYYLEGFSDGWSDWEDVYYKDFTNLPHGNYNFRVKAKNVYHDESIEDSFEFIILRPWYLTIVAFLIYIILAVLIVYVIIVLYTRRLKNENIRLEGIIQERTAEIRKQKEELTDSIEYASRIQRALLPPDQMLDKHDIEHFILFRPRDIVSGDFYWIGVKDHKIFIVAADCTGHGVPGAFMSMLGISFLDEIVIKSGVSETNKILDALRQHVITSLRQTGKSMAESTKDGMDLAMIAIDEKDKHVQYSGAYNPLYAVRPLTKEEKGVIDKGGELELDRGDLHNDTHLLTQVKADQMPIGISEKDFDFTAKTIKDVSSSTLYLFSDGYLDQFGGFNGKKFMAKNFKKLLLEIQGLSMEKQHDKLNQTLIQWMGDISQIDDVLVIGIKLG